MILNRLTPCEKFIVYTPRYHDRKALLKNNHIATHNEIIFPYANSMPGSWYISGTKARTYPTMQMKTKSGSYVTMREIPLDDLERLERE